MSDNLDNILSGVEAVEPEAPETDQPEQAETAPEPEQAEAQPEQTDEKPDTPAEKEPDNIPYAVFKSTREDLKAQLAEARAEAQRLQQQSQQPKQEPEAAPDVLEDQEGFTRSIVGGVQQQMTQQKLQMSRFFAEREFGGDTVKEAIAFFDQNPQLSHQFLNEPSPFHAAVEFVQKQKAAAEIGPDPAAYRQKLEAEIRQKIEAELAAKQVSEMASKSPPSMANANGSGGQRDPGWQGPSSLDSILGG